MIEIRRIKDCTTPLYEYSERLLVTSFPPEERRDTKDMRIYIEHKENFYYNLLLDEDTPIGLLTYWDFTSHCYVEHFAIDPALRKKGYGSQALTSLYQKIQQPLILEVETPETEDACRRIRFYQQQGFVLREISYFQPPYRNGDSWIPMRLMTRATNEPDKLLQTIIAKIYREVYNIPQTEIEHKLQEEIK